jgi:hypothetical protein
LEKILKKEKRKKVEKEERRVLNKKTKEIFLVYARYIGNSKKKICNYSQKE